MFAGSNFDADDFDDYNIIQRDLRVDGGLRPVSEEDVVAVRKAPRALQGLFDKLGLPTITDEEVEAATYARGSQDMPERDMVQDIKHARIINARCNWFGSGKRIIRKWLRRCSDQLAQSIETTCSGDFLQTSSIFDADWNVISAVNDKNDYAGPGTDIDLTVQNGKSKSNP